MTDRRAMKRTPIVATLRGSHPCPATHEIHVWHIALDTGLADLAWRAGALAADERDRAERFRLPRDRARFIVAHSALRAILGHYVGVAPAALVLAHTSTGKPFIQDPPQAGAMAVVFNLSHSHEAALVAVGRGCAVGVDIERIRPELAEQRIAERFFAPEEVAALRSLPSAAQRQAFFDCWTRKEAFVKARGEGLAFPPNRFTVSLAPGEPAALRSVAGDPAEAGRWHLQALTVRPGYAAALAFDGQPRRVVNIYYTARGHNLRFTFRHIMRASW